MRVVIKFWNACVACSYTTINTPDILSINSAGANLARYVVETGIRSPLRRDVQFQLNPGSKVTSIIAIIYNKLFSNR